MKKTTERHRLNLSLSMDALQQRQAWDILSGVPPGQRTEAVCRMICGYQDQGKLLNGIRSIIREELQGAAVLKENTVRQAEAGDVDADVLGFLLALQEGGDDS